MRPRERRARLTGETPMNLWSLASSFHQCALTLMQADAMTRLGSGELPTFYLLCHGLELGMKAHLRAQGMTASDLRGLGHDLTRIQAAAKQRGLARAIAFTDTDDVVIKILSPVYSGKHLEYVIQRGLMSLPRIQLIEDLLNRMLKATEQECREATM